MTITLRTDPSAAMYAGTPASAQVKFLVVSSDRCRVAPKWPLLYYAFPSPSSVVYTATVPSLQATCDENTPKELELEDPYKTWAYSSLLMLGSGYGANMSGYIARNALTEARGTDEQQCSVVQCQSGRFGVIYETCC